MLMLDFRSTCSRSTNGLSTRLWFFRPVADIVAVRDSPDLTLNHELDADVKQILPLVVKCGDTLNDMT